MEESESAEELLFEVATPLGFTIRVTRPQWTRIVRVKHPVMRGKEAEVRATLASPNEIRRSRSDPMVHLFYRIAGERRWVCGVAKRQDGHGFLITAYPTDAIKEGETIWPK